MNSPHQPQGINRWELCCLALLGVIFLIRFPVVFLCQPPFLMDFNVYHYAATLVTTGQGSHLYDIGYKAGMFFRYGPHWALLWAPLAYLSLYHSGVLWSVLSVCWLLVTLWLSGRILTRLGLPYPWWTAAVVALLLVRQLISVFSLGQADLWSGGLLSLFVFFELADRSWLAALMLALSITLKLPAAIFLPYLFCTGRWRRAVQTLLWISVLIILGSSVLEPGHPGQLLVAWARSLALTSPGQAFTIGDQSLMALIGRYGMADMYGLNILSLSRKAAVVLTVLVDAGLFVSIVLPDATAKRHPLRLAYDTALLMPLMVLASPAAWMATYTTLVFPMFLACGSFMGAFQALRRDRSSTILMGVVGLLCLFMQSKFWKMLHVYYWKGESYVYLVFMVLPWLGLALFGVLWRGRRLRLKIPVLPRIS